MYKTYGTHRQTAEGGLGRGPECADTQAPVQSVRRPNEGGLGSRIVALLVIGADPFLSKGDVPGHEFHGNQYKDGSGSSKDTNEQRRLKVERALATHKPSTQEKQRKADAAERSVAAIVSGTRTDNNNPVDVTVGKRVGVEVKAVMDNGNNKITMHPESKARKEAWAKENKASLHTVVVDTRSGKMYYREGVGSFRIHNMTPVTAKELKSLLKGKK
jgi:hypothetical protein